MRCGVGTPVARPPRIVVPRAASGGGAPGHHQTFTRSSGARYIRSPGLTSNAV
jgi:hypothetical protein